MVPNSLGFVVFSAAMLLAIVLLIPFCGGIKEIRKNPRFCLILFSVAVLTSGGLSSTLHPWYERTSVVESETYSAPRGYKIVVANEREWIVKSPYPQYVERTEYFNLFRRSLNDKYSVKDFK